LRWLPLHIRRHLSALLFWPAPIGSIHHCPLCACCLSFAGKDLNQQELRDGFSSCMADASSIEEAAAASAGA
jgi:hypothetical protein